MNQPNQPEKKIKTGKELKAWLDELETQALQLAVIMRLPARLPNADWDENDPREAIDFPCSNTWLDYYHLRGLTPRHSESYRGPRPDYKYYIVKKEQPTKKGRAV